MRDAWDACAVAGVAVKLVAEGERAIELVTDASGTIDVPTESEGWTVVVPRPWMPLSNGSRPCADGDDLWLWRPQSVLVTVRGDDGSSLDPTSVSLFAVPGGSFAPGPARRSTPPPANTDWLRQRGLRTSRLEGSMVGAGAWRVQLPRVKGMCVSAFSPGWRPAVQPLPDAPPDQEVSILLVLRPTQWVTGRLRSSGGAPLAGAKLVLYSTRNGRYEDASEEYLNTIGADRGGFGASWTRGQDSSEQMFASQCVTAADGSFRVDVRNPGRVLVLAYAEGHSRVAVELGTFDGHRELELVATAHEDPDSILVELDKSRIKQAAFALADMSYDDEQPAFDVHSDAEGRIRTTWLVSGRRYALIPLGPPVPEAHRRPHYFTYANQTVLDLATMSMKYK